MLATPTIQNTLATVYPFAPHTVMPLYEAAFFHECLLQCGHLTVKQPAGKVEQDKFGTFRGQ
jgi:hypothetical protein